ncbi:MAG TPA: 3-carboxy-cis,cis-muconate cycloisomerase [Solirubrobacteraceae bacterium]|nr:3-carboxy-cis,cis-muconate cycloisomerase [Solirubrobacteraceae bacterium]
MTSSELFGGLFVPAAVRDAVSDRAWIAAMLEFEAALAAAEARAGVIPGEAADTIAAACDAERFDAGALGREARAAGNPAAPLVRALTEAVEGDAARYVHWGATSQDVMDTASMLVARRALALIGAELDAVAAACAGLADEHRATVMPGRTMLQQALPITFGQKAAGWLAAVVDARRRLAVAPLAVELGGAAGTLASLGGEGLRVLGLLAEQLELEEPLVPWHTSRGRVAELGASLALAAGTLEKIAHDVTLLAQTEVAEVAEPAGGDRGGSSTLPHKRNPVGSALAVACARRVRGEASILLDAMRQEHERAAGAWQAEWEALSGALAYTGGAAGALREVLDGLEVRPDRMRENLAATDGLVLAESVSMAMAERLGRLDAHMLVEAACRRAVEAGRPLRDELLDDAEIRAQLDPEEIDRALDPAGYLGSAEAFVERALERYREDL